MTAVHGVEGKGRALTSLPGIIRLSGTMAVLLMVSVDTEAQVLEKVTRVAAAFSQRSGLSCHHGPWSRRDSENGREGMHPMDMTAEIPQREDGQDTGPDSQGSGEEPAADQSRD